MPPRARTSPCSVSLQALQSFPSPWWRRVRPGCGRGHHDVAALRFGLCGRQRSIQHALREPGACPEAGSSLLLQNLIGYHRAAEKLMLGEAFYAEEALEMGLANRVLPPHEVNGYAQAQAAKLAAKPATSLRITKALMKQHHPTLPAVMMEEGKHFQI